MDTMKPLLSFGTKAETLERIRPCVTRSTVPDILYFSVEDFEADECATVDRVREKFGSHELVIRSSAQGEDSADCSMAGAFHSCLRVDASDPDAIRTAIKKVRDSYGKGNGTDQILVQPMIGNIEMSGVIMTRDIDHGSPYYVINYDDESGSTDSVTGGTGINKTVLVFRHCKPEQIRSKRIRQLVDMVREVETFFPDQALDIEFCTTRSGKLYLFQVRPMTVTANWNSAIETEISNRLAHVEQFVRDRSHPRSGVSGQKTILGEMPDWNPAEIIGTTPRPLAASLYREIVTRKIWRVAREEMGYQRLPGEELMVVVGGRPFIDVRNSFNSFLPEGLDENLKEKLINAWIDRLDNLPHLHDKVEFDIAQTCLDFTFDENFSTRYEDALSADEYSTFRKAVAELTRKNVTMDEKGSLACALQKITSLESQQRQVKFDWHSITGTLDILTNVRSLLDDCGRHGTLPFSGIARHAFMAESLLRSAIARGALSASRVKDFKQGVRTVTSELTADLAGVGAGRLSEIEFMERYGHLRPGTYDIMSLRYADRKDLFDQSLIPDRHERATDFELTASERSAISKLLKEAGLQDLGVDDLFQYAHHAIVGREHAKFVFTRHLSDALEGLAEWGQRLGFSRDDLSYLDLDDILNLLTHPVMGSLEEHLQNRISEGRRRVELAGALRMSFLIRSPEDVYVVPLYRSAPNFVGTGRIEGSVVALSATTSGEVDLKNRIICIENADPGFDWIFTKGILGLITKYGGVNSHMAIRCAEFGLPAAIGCGDQIFERLISAGNVELNCGNKILRPIYVD